MNRQSHCQASMTSHWVWLLMMLSCLSPALAIKPPVDSRPLPPRPSSPPRATQPDLAAPQAERAAPPVADRAVAGERPILGVILDPVPELLGGHLGLELGEGVLVGEVIPAGPAAQAGLSKGDIILKVTDQPVGSPEEVRAAIERHAVGDVVALSLVQRGQRVEREVELGAAPAADMADFQHDGEPLDGFLQELPGRQADLIREALERNLRAFEDLESGGLFGEPFHQGLMRRLQQEMGMGGGGMDSRSSIRLLDHEGSIEMLSRNGRKEVRVFDEAGELLWEGPYDTEADKAAVPDDIRQRIEKLNVDMDFGGQGMQLQLGPGRYRSLDELGNRR